MYDNYGFYVGESEIDERQPPSGQPFGRPPQFTQPPGPPPQFVPQIQGGPGGQFQAQAVDPGAIRGCLYRWTYIWLRNRQQFWFFPVFVGRRSVAGYVWFRGRYFYFGVDLNRIVSFRCF